MHIYLALISFISHKFQKPLEFPAWKAIKMSFLMLISNTWKAPRSSKVD